MVVIGAMYSKMDYVLSWQVRYAVWFDAFTPKFPSQCSDAESCGAEPMRPHRIGILAQDLQPSLLETFSDELRKLGYVEGNAISIEVRNAAGQNERLPGLAKELLQLNVEVIQMEQLTEPDADDLS